MQPVSIDQVFTSISDQKVNKLDHVASRIDRTGTARRITLGQDNQVAWRRGKAIPGKCMT